MKAPKKFLLPVRVTDMLFIDDVIFRLQRAGGISVYFRELLNYLASNQIDCESGFPEFTIVPGLKMKLPLVLGRYLDCEIPRHISVFHSSYYRCPDIQSCKSVVTVHDLSLIHI